MSNNTARELVLSYLPPSVSEAVRESAGRTSAGVSEIRLRSNGACSLTVMGMNRKIDVAVGDLEMREIFRRICGGAVFAHRDDVCRGFIALPCGIRVGVCGRARYEGGDLTGVGDISSLVFRIPTGECSFGKELYSDWLKMRGGMLICSRAGEGKTTAIRSLARLIGSGEGPLRVAVVDERCEFDLSEYVGSHVDILRGYRRSLGVDIAIRTMTAEVIVVDEISSREDSRALLSALGAGVSVIATAHADGLDSALRREYIREMVTEGLFESCCSIKRRGERFGYTIEKISDKTEISSHVMGVI